ncbi:unnamed protein product [Rhodiola kirilowii]
MGADQCRKRPSSNNTAGCSSSELHKTKKKSLTSLQFGGLDMKPHISIELDGSHKRVVAKREQIALSRRDLAPYSTCVPNHHKTLADVITLPKEFFALENLEDVFSYEVWSHYLSEDERGLLSQFLPKHADTEEVVQSLFGGSNFSFGNPVLKWFTLLASGNLHPDAMIHRDLTLLASQKGYCSELQDYHNGMVRNLLHLKDLWEGCQDPAEFEQIIGRFCRTGDYTVKGTFAPEKSQCSDPNIGWSSESLFAMVVEKACGSDDQAVIVTRSGELEKSRGFKPERTRSPMLDISDNQNDVARPIKGERLSNGNSLVDGAKYMAYIKISKKKLELLKSMTQPGKCIQSKSVNHVLGNMDSYYAQPYVVFEEDEQRKLHNQWLVVVNTVPQASADWRVRQAQKDQIMQLLCKDIKENPKHVLLDEEPTGCTQTNQKCFVGTNPALNMKDDDVTVAELAGIQDTLRHDTVDFGGFEGNDVTTRQDMVVSVDNHCIQKADCIISSDEGILGMESEKDAYINEIHESYMNGPPDFPSSSYPSLVTDIRGDTQSVGRGSWQTSKLPLSPHQSTLVNEYTADVSGFSCNSERQHQFHYSGTELHENGIKPRTEPSMPYRLTNQNTPSAYRNEDRNELLSILSNPDLSSYKQQFQQTPDVMMGNVPLPIQYQEPLHQSYPFEASQKRNEQFYMNQNLTNSMHDTSRDTNGLSLRLQEHLPPFHLQDWHANSVGMSEPLPTQSCAGEMFTQNWYSSGQQGHWSNSPNEVYAPNQSIANKARNNDESLFSVLSQCNELRSATSYDHRMGSPGQVMAQVGFGVTGGNISRYSNVIPQVSHPLDFLNGREAAPSLLPSSMGWVSVPHQNPSLHDLTGKPFIRSWNQ